MLTTTQEGASPASLSDCAENVAQHFVGQLPFLVRGLSDDERERHIQSCTLLMEQAYERYRETSDLGDRGESDRWRLMRDEAIRGRSPEQVARMEAERGLR